jgi:hypothetical protein
MIWQFAATTTPATMRPPSIFSTLSRDIGAGHFNLLPSSVFTPQDSSLGLQQQHFQDKHQKKILENSLPGIGIILSLYTSTLELET